MDDCGAGIVNETRLDGLQEKAGAASANRGKGQRSMIRRSNPGGCEGPGEIYAAAPGGVQAHMREIRESRGRVCFLRSTLEVSFQELACKCNHAESGGEHDSGFKLWQPGSDRRFSGAGRSSTSSFAGPLVASGFSWSKRRCRGVRCRDLIVGIEMSVIMQMPVIFSPSAAAGDSRRFTLKFHSSVSTDS